MKFGKEFKAQMVQEWQEAYMNYNQLKTLLKDIQRFKNRNKSKPMSQTPSHFHFRSNPSLQRAFSGLATGPTAGGSPGKKEEDVILVSPVGAGEGIHHEYQTVFLNAADEGGELEQVFFRRLDDEFNKVMRFYRSKVGEVVGEAGDLSKQMDALIALRVKVENLSPAMAVGVLILMAVMFARFRPRPSMVLIELQEAHWSM